MGVVIPLFKNQSVDKTYEAKIEKMDMIQVMQEMVEFQQIRTKTGHLTIELIRKGLPLFKRLMDSATTDELRVFASSYYKHLQKEYSVLSKTSA